MKFIKLFEELSPEVYINAGNKLAAKNQKGRGENLKRFGNSLINGEPIKPIITQEFNYKIYHDYFGEDEIIDCKFIGYECLFCGADESEESFEELLADDYQLSYTIVPKFETVDGKLMIPFEMCVYLYSKARGAKKNRLLKLDIKLEQTQTDCDLYCGIFADRTSANRFVKQVLPKVLDDTANFRVQDVVSFLDKPSDDLEKIYDIFDKIDIHYLYGDSCESIGNNKISILKK